MQWGQMEDNLFSANHRNRMIANGNGTMAQVYTLENLINEYDLRQNTYQRNLRHNEVSN